MAGGLGKNGVSQMMSLRSKSQKDASDILLTCIFKYIRNTQGTRVSFFLPCSDPPLRNGAV